MLDCRFSVAAILIALGTIHASDVRAQTPAQDLEALITQGRELASRATPDKRGMVAIVKDCVRVARSADAEGDATTATNAWNAVIGGLDVAADAISAKQQFKIRLVAAQGLRDAGEDHDAIVALQPVLGATDVRDVANAERLLLQIGSSNYQAGRYPVARMAWQPLAERKDGHETAELGLAWLTLAEQPDEHQAIAAAMMNFAKKHASHPDALTAMQQATIHFAAANRHEEAVDAFRSCTRIGQQRKTKLLDEAIDAVVSLKADSPSFVSIATWLCDDANRLINADRAVFAARLLKHDPDRFETAVNALVRLNENASLTKSLMDDVGGDLVAPLIAAHLGDDDVSPSHQLVAVQWFAKQGQWSSIAVAAAMDPDQLTGDHENHRRLTRLIAESFTRTLDQERAHAWWSHVVDDLGDATFASKLRLAECSVTLDPIDMARQRIDDANAAAEGKPASIALVQFLRADVAIRDLRFEEARQTLESVIRNVAVTTDLRARAQWMLGETHFMQEDFASAIKAYRLVEGISPDSSWAAASLVQAGKSFERLGRTQAAAVCYGTLLSRFSDSPHADDVRRRVAALSPEARPHPQPTDPILRR